MRERERERKTERERKRERERERGGGEEKEGMKKVICNRSSKRGRRGRGGACKIQACLDGDVDTKRWRR